MSGTTQVTPAELATMSQQAADANSSVQGQLSQVRGVIDGVRSGWEGQAQAAFSSLMNSWDTDVKKLNDALMGISDTLKSSGTSFDQSQQDHVASINQVASSSLNL